MYITVIHLACHAEIGNYLKRKNYIKQVPKWQDDSWIGNC